MFIRFCFLYRNTPTSEKSLNSPIATNGNSTAHDHSADIYEAIYAYEATDPSDLTFDVGERIIVLKRDGDWWTGQVGDRTGTFPYNYVQKIDHTNVSSVHISIRSIFFDLDLGSEWNCSSNNR